MPVWDLIPGPRCLAPEGAPRDDAITRLQNVLLPTVFGPHDADASDLSSTRAEPDETWIVHYSGRFGEAAMRLVALILAVEAAVQHYTCGADATRALELYAEVHWLTAYTLFRARAWRALADRGRPLHRGGTTGWRPTSYGGARGVWATCCFTRARLARRGR
jgi:hypothetical protein